MLPSKLCRQILLNKSHVNLAKYSVQTVKLPKQHEWNRAIASAERLVGFPTSAIHLKTLFSEDANVTEHVRKLMGSDHPVLKSFKRLIIQGGQVSWKLIMKQRIRILSGYLIAFNESDVSLSLIFDFLNFDNFELQL